MGKGISGMVRNETATSEAPKATKPRAPRVKRDPDAARKILEARIEKLKAQLEKKSAELTTVIDPAMADLEARLKRAKSELGATNRFLALRNKGLGTMLADLAEQRAKISALESAQDRQLARVASLQEEYDAAKAGVSGEVDPESDDVPSEDNDAE